MSELATTTPETPVSKSAAEEKAPADEKKPDEKKPVPNGLTPRALIAGFILSLVLCGVNSYLTLSFGVIEEGPTIAALFFFAFFFLSSTKINSSEMAIVATMGSAGGSLGFITNFYAAEAMAASPYSFWQMAGFSVVTSLVGLVFVIPLRQLLILKEKLPWPGSKAVESVIRALVEHGDPKQPYILLATCVTMIAYVVLNDEDGYGLVPSGSTIAIAGIGAYGAAIAWSPSRSAAPTSWASAPASASCSGPRRCSCSRPTCPSPARRITTSGPASASSSPPASRRWPCRARPSCSR